ncbi:putative histidine kinase [Methanocella paludicola SANAE]|uniref:histidine kinase n=1 Tax=Methanocella paludicola (strain DSM 17711 / JCM 13418 / NBRC 101707 / SANAE) TaxID=304371 RepID=D1YYG3_METPS|nr:PAS domain S-box protein [Methanocella paludicola]BAI61485.1 putative histidine kinase [Methanocella paludicola SANAE]
MRGILIHTDIKIGDRPETFYHSILDSLTSNIAILNDSGIIIDINDSWDRFALQNGIKSLDKVGVGVSYFEVCRKAHGEHSDEAPVALDGLLSVLKGNISYFELEYPCDSPDKKRWFLMRATRFMENSRKYLVVTHIDITRRKMAETELLASYKELETRYKAQAEISKDYGDMCKESIIEKKRLEEALRKSEKKFQNLLERAPFAIYIYRGEKNCCYVNPAAEALTGYTRDEFINMSYWDIAHPDYRELVKERGIKRQKGVTVPARYQIKIITKSGDGRWIDINAANIMFERKPAVLVTMIDITEQKLAEETLSEARAQAEVYIDLMSHDINNMNQIAMGSLELFLDRSQTGKKIEGEDLKLLRSSYLTLQSISRLIDNVRKIQSLKSGMIRPEVVDTGLMIAEVIKAYENIPGRDVKIHYTPVFGYMVKACELFQDVIVNIIDNAIKHSTGPLLINIEDAEVIEDGKKYYRIFIEDNGPGIPDEKKKDIFERYKRGDTKARGRGLGLYLVKTLIDDFGGKVWAEDRVPGEYGKGSKFVIMLPAIT